MLFFRSEEDVVAWCAERKLPLRPLVSMSQLWYLADTWYSNRLTVDSRRPAAAEMVEIFAAVGLEGSFWDPFADSWSAQRQNKMKGNNVRIRSYTEGDEQGVVALWRQVYPGAPAWNRPEEDIRRKLHVQRELFLVAVVEDQIIGTAMAGYDGHRGWVYYVAVAPDQRRRGIGSALMGEVERRLIQMGCSKLNLQVRASNEAVVSFYRQLGYDVEERISMGKRLTSLTTGESGAKLDSE